MANITNLVVSAQESLAVLKWDENIDDNYEVYVGSPGFSPDTEYFTNLIARTDDAEVTIPQGYGTTRQYKVCGLSDGVRGSFSTVSLTIDLYSPPASGSPGSGASQQSIFLVMGA